MSVIARRSAAASPVTTSSLLGGNVGVGSASTSASSGGRGASQARLASTNKGAPSLAARLLNQSAPYNTSAISSAKARAKPAAKVAAKPAAADAAKADAKLGGEDDAKTKAAKAAKKNALDRVLGEIDANFGKGSIMKLGTASQAKVATFPSGAMTLDIALGGGMAGLALFTTFFCVKTPNRMMTASMSMSV
jgi:recombination protein RecA